MAQPTAYTRQYDFSDYQDDFPDDPLPGNQVDIEFNAVRTSLNATITNLGLIQADDGSLRNESVAPETLDSDTLALISNGLSFEGAWVTATAYAIGDVVRYTDGATYVCLVAHTSGTFATDLTAAKWFLFANPVGALGDIVFLKEDGDAAEDTFTLPTAVLDEKQLLVFVDGDIVDPEAGYTVSGTSITFTTPPPSGTGNILIFGIDQTAVASANEAADSATLAEDWATKTNGAVDGGSEYSAKAYAIGGTGVTDTASKGAAKEWAIETTGTVDGTSYSAKEYAQGTQSGASTGGSAKSWAQKTDGAVDGGTAYAAKAWAVGGTGVTDTASAGAAKEWATAAEDDTVDGTEYSAKHYAAKAAADATLTAADAISTAADAVSTAADVVSSAANAAAALASELAAAASVASGMYDNTQDKSANYTVVAADEGDLFRVDTSGGAVTMTLTAISTLADFKVAIAKITGDANNVTVQGSGGDTINGSASYTLDAQYENVTLISETGSTDWFAVGGGASASGFANPDYFSGDGADVTFTLSRDPGTENQIDVRIDGVAQQRTTYSVSGTTLTFGAAPASGTNNIEVIYLAGVALDIGTPSANSVGSEELNKEALTGQTDTAIATGDSILYSDASDSGNLKKDTVQGILDLVAVTDETITTSDVTTNNASTAKHGFLKKLSNVSTEFMNGVGDWATVAGGAVDIQAFTASDTWEKPASGTYAIVMLGGGGGSGGKGTTTAGGGGGGGAYVEAIIPLSALGATETVTIGAGGTAETVANNDGQPGGNTTFGAHVTAYGGGGGGGSANTGGGGGGGAASPGVSGSTKVTNISATVPALALYRLFGSSSLTISGGMGCSGGAPNGGRPAFTDGTNACSMISAGKDGGGAGGIYAGGSGLITQIYYTDEDLVENGVVSDTLTGCGGCSINGGGGGGGGSSTTVSGGAGGSSIHGGGGGGGGALDVAPGPTGGGLSKFGGAGGAGAYDANAATAGSQAAVVGGGGGGGGSETGTSGAGGAGTCVVIVI